MRDENGKPWPVEIQSRQAKYDQAPDLLLRGHWVCLNIEPSCSWPVWPQSLHFSGYKIWIIPLTFEDHPGVAIRRPSEMKTEEAERLLYRFLNVLAWRNDCGITVAYRSGGALPSMIGPNKKYGFSTRKLFDFTEINCPEDDDALIALALMRKARGLNHIGYAFLSFWRVLELAFPLTRERVTWMSRTLPKLSGQDIQTALKSIADSGISDVGKHLFDSGRCAIAHATGKPIVNPDDPRDAERLFLELPLVRGMAVRAIEDRFGILTQFAEYDLHLYELRGWRKILGSELIERFMRNEKGRPDEMIELPDIHVRLRECPPYKSMENMSAVGITLNNGSVKLFYRSSDSLFEICFSLDFQNERLLFAVNQGLFIEDNESVAAAEHFIEIERFIRDYFLNGELQMWNAQTDELLSRKDACIPLNCLLDLDASNARIENAKSELNRRKLKTIPGRQ